MDQVDGSEGGDSEVQRTMLELLNQLDGFEPSQNIKVLTDCLLQRHLSSSSSSPSSCSLVMIIL